MVVGKIESDWDRQSCLLALLANCHRDPKKHPKAYTPQEFNPIYLSKKRTASRIKSFSEVPELKKAFQRMSKKKKGLS